MFFDNVNIISLKNLVENLFSLVGNPLKTIQVCLELIYSEYRLPYFFRKRARHLVLI